MESFYAALALVCLSVPGLVFRSVSSAVSLSHLLPTLPYSRWLEEGGGWGLGGGVLVARVFELGLMIGGRTRLRSATDTVYIQLQRTSQKYFEGDFFFLLGGGGSAHLTNHLL